MKYLIIILALVGCASIGEPVVFKEASVGAASTNPDYWRRPIQVCGHVTQGRGPEGEWILEGTGYSASQWLLVDARVGRLQPGREACARGVVRRRDGGTRDTFYVIVDGANPEYVLYPCADAASCREAAGKMPE